MRTGDQATAARVTFHFGHPGVVPISSALDEHLTGHDRVQPVIETGHPATGWLPKRFRLGRDGLTAGIKVQRALHGDDVGMPGATGRQPLISRWDAFDTDQIGMTKLVIFCSGCPRRCPSGRDRMWR